MPFLIFRGCGILQSSCRLVRTSPPKLRLLLPHEDWNQQSIMKAGYASMELSLIPREAVVILEYAELSEERAATRI
jgi:hypothetical protein